MLSAKELMHLEDFLGMEQTAQKAFSQFASDVDCQQTKQLFQQIAQKHQQNFQTISKHLNAGQNLQ